MSFEYTCRDIVRIPVHVAIRRRPGLFLCEPKSARTLRLVRDLLLFLFEVYPAAECPEESEAFLLLEGDGTVRLFNPGFTQTLQRLMSHVQNVSAPGFSGLALATALSSRIQVDLWRDGRQWRVHGMNGFCVTSLREIHPEPMPTHAAGGLRVECQLDPEFFGRRVPSVKQLRQCLADVSAREPRLRVHLLPPG